jgi:hypothetical protein
MPIQQVTIKPVNTMNRRDVIDMIADDEVSTRENFIVEGVGNNKVNRKSPGSKRITSSALTNKFTWLGRYYSGSTAKTFGYSNGALYHVSPAGATTSKVGSLEPTAYPHSEIMKVSGANIMYFVDGFNGMYSHDGNDDHSWKKESSVTLNFVYIISHLDRMWGFTEDSEDLYFSKNLVPTDFTDVDDSGTITIGAKRGKKIMAMALLNEVLYIFKEDSIWVLVGRTPSEFQVREIHPFLGTSSRFSVQNVETAIMFLASDFEVYSFGGTFDSTKLISYNIALGGDLTSHLPEIINTNRVDQCYGAFHNHFYRLSFVETTQTENKMEYLFNTVNQTDSFTRGNNVSCYVVLNTLPDKNLLYTGRSDTGHIMLQYDGKNYDNDDSTSTMSYKIRTKSVRAQDEAVFNVRWEKIWANIKVQGAQLLPINYYLDARNANSDARTENMTTQGETKSVATITINSQESISSRAVLKRAGSIGQSISLEIDDSGRDIDIVFSSFVLDAIVKTKKRNEKVGV